jgi:hypothetical protein
MSKVERKTQNGVEAAKVACGSLLRDATKCLERAAIFEYLLREVVPHFVPEPGKDEPEELLVVLGGGPMPADIATVVDVEQDLLALAKRDRDRAEALFSLQVPLPDGVVAPIVDETAGPLSSTTVSRRSARRDQTKG